MYERESSAFKKWLHKLFSNYTGNRNRTKTGDVAVTLFLLILALFSSIPLVMSISMALKPLNELFYYPPRLFPNSPTLSNFSQLFTLMGTTWVPFSRYIFNTVFLTLATTIGHVLLASMAAYPLAKNNFAGKELMNRAVLYSLMFVATVADVANFLTISELGMLDTYWAVIIPSWGAPLGLFIIRNYLTTIPDSLLEAARIDGCTDIGIYCRIIMPISKPAWITVIILTFQASWGATNSQYIYSEELKTLPYALNQIVSGGIIRQGAGQAASVLMLLVPAIVFIINQSNVVNTMATSGMKE